MKRTLGILCAFALTATLAACTGGTSKPNLPESAQPGTAANEPALAAATDKFPLTIKHAYGETTIPAEPKKIAVVGIAAEDTLLKLGIVPTGWPDVFWGGGDNLTTPWRDQAAADLGAARGSAKYPKQYSEKDGLNVQAVAALQPDLIIGVYSGMTDEEYQKLSAVAPTIAPPGKAWGTRYDEVIKLTSQAVGRSKDGERILAELEKNLADLRASHPKLQGKTFVSGNLDPKNGTIGAYSTLDNRYHFAVKLGLKPSPTIADEAKTSDKFYFMYPAEQADKLNADVIIGWVNTPAEIDLIKTHPLLSKIPAVKAGQLLLDSDKTRTYASSAASPLSWPIAAKEYANMLEEIFSK